MDNTKVLVENIPAELKAVSQWVCWKYAMQNGKQSKLPIDCKTGNVTSATSCESFYTFEEAVAFFTANPGKVSGIGFVFTRDDSFSGVDLDDCRDPQTGEIQPKEAEIIRSLNSYAEVSPSGTGVKIFVRGKLPAGSRSRKDKIEVYSDKRYFTVTGQKLPDVPSTVEDRQEELLSLYEDVFGTSTPATNGVGPSNGPAACATDQDVIASAMRAQNGDKFAKLWKGDVSGYTSESEADLALCSMLCYWGANDPERLEGLFRQSTLGQRNKWKERRDYRERTIATAISSTKRRGTSQVTTRATKSNQSNQSNQKKQEEPRDIHRLGLQAVEAFPALAPEQESKALELATTLADDVGNLRDWEAAFKLARRLQSLTKEGPERFFKAAEAFCTATGRPVADFWYAFLTAWDRVKVPENEGPLRRAVEVAREKLASLQGHRLYHALLLATVAWYLSEFTEDGLFWLPREELGELLEVAPKTITNIVNLLEKRGIVSCEDDNFSYKQKLCKLYSFSCARPELTLLSAKPCLPPPVDVIRFEP